MPRAINKNLATKERAIKVYFLFQEGLNALQISRALRISYNKAHTALRKIKMLVLSNSNIEV